MAATCSAVMPLAMMKNANRNSGYDDTAAAGRNSTAPTAVTSKPVMMVAR